MELKTLLEKANRKLDVEGMNRELVDKVREVITEMHGQGIYICVAQGYRSIREQNELYAQGRTTTQLKRAGITDVEGKPSLPKVTNAKGGTSNHNFGVAVDFALYTEDGKDVVWAVNEDFMKVVSAMKTKGFKWGGDWKSFKDNPHFELYDVVGGEKPKEYNQEVKPSSSPASTKSPFLGVIRILVTNLNVRSGAGKENGVIHIVSQGQMFNVTANYKNEWMEILLPDGRKGWVCIREDGEDYVSLIKTY